MRSLLVAKYSPDMSVNLFANSFDNVDFPSPFAPSKAILSSASILNERRFSTVFPLYPTFPLFITTNGGRNSAGVGNENFVTAFSTKAFIGFIFSNILMRD